MLFNANKVYDRQVMEGIGEYLQASQCNWDIFLDETFTTHIDDFKAWQGDGVIADFDDPAIRALLADTTLPVVGVGALTKTHKIIRPYRMWRRTTKHWLNWLFSIYAIKGWKILLFTAPHTMTTNTGP
ncbi:xylose activator XylR AraC family [Photobacterium aphoticum]|uniref:Xylose activator XylR AraC family n=1 Tax=Photobacterium aphoticum TaxID=754436 RepID=A0A090QN17_9GAMM|nr:xylose activator XylR AraC family [Photobacterium aphoticum]